MTKNIFTASAFALALTVSVSASAEMMFTKTLKVGSRGAEVSALQARLNVTPTGYFGSKTRAAVVAYQLENSISQTGVVGPLTRAALNMVASNVVTPAASTTVAANTNTSTTLSGSEGFAEVRINPTPTNNPNVLTSSDVAVYGIEFKAKQSDVMVERVNLEVSVDNNGSKENPSTLINKVTIKEGTTVLATIPVTSTTFSKDTSVSPLKYYLQVSGLGLKVAKDSAKVLTVHFDTNSIDSSRIVNVNVYGDSGIRTVDGRSISSYNKLADVRTHTFKKPGTSDLTAKTDATTVYSTNYRVRTTGSGAEKVLTSTFAAKSETGPSKITSVTVMVSTSTLGTTTTAINPTNLYLYDGATLVDARSISSNGTVTFDLNSYNITVDTDMTKTFVIKADLPSNTVNGTLVRTTVTAVSYEKPNGSATALTSLNIAGPFHYFAQVVPQFGKVSSTATVIRNGSNNSVTGIETKFVATITAQGGDVSTSTNAIIALINTATGATAATTSVNGVVESGLTAFAEGAVKNIEFTANFASSSIPSAGVYKAVVRSVTWSAVNPAYTVTQTAGFEAMDTSAVTY